MFMSEAPGKWGNLVVVTGEIQMSLGKRSHRSDQEEFYQLLTYTDDVDLNKKLAQWEEFYNFNRPHGAHGGNTPYEALRTMLE